MTATLVDRFTENATNEALFAEPGVALAAVSGGADSLALVDLMVCCAPEFGLELAVAHINHGTGEHADAAEAVARGVAADFGLAFHCARLELPADWSETTAREMRYRELECLRAEVAAGCLVLGHNLDDQIETVLLRFLNGSGIGGLAGMSGVSGFLVRPLLPFSRLEIEEWLASRGLLERVVRDPSNDDVRHDRNWVRHELLPLVRSRFPIGPTGGLLRTSLHAAEEREAWARALRIEELRFRTERDWAEVARAPLKRYDKLLCEALLRGFARELGVVLGRRQSALVRRFVAEGTSGHSLDIGDGWRVQLEFDRVRLSRAAPAVARPESLTVVWDEVASSVSWGRWRFEAVPDDAGRPLRESLSTWVHPGPVTIRGLAEGDRIRPLGGSGARPVRRLLMEAKVPAPVRWRYPIIESGGKVLWVPGVCRSSAGVPEVGARVIRIDTFEA